MSEFSQKIKRVRPLIRARKGQLDREATILAAIRKEKEAMNKKLQELQSIYMDGVEKINHERQSIFRNTLDALERGVDYAKSQWHKTMQALRTIEAQENAQIAQLQTAERNLKSVEKLEERYTEQAAMAAKLTEQKELDAVANRQIANRKEAKR